MLEITSTEEFKQHAYSGKVVILYHAEWCIPSRDLKSMLINKEDWFQEQNIEVLCLEQDDETAKKIFEKRKISSFPCIEGFENREIKGKYEGKPKRNENIFEIIESWYSNLKD